MFADVPSEQDFGIAGTTTDLRKWLEERKAEYENKHLSRLYICPRCNVIGSSQPGGSIRVIKAEDAIAKYRQQAKQWNDVTIDDKFREVYGTSNKMKIQETLTPDQKGSELVSKAFSKLIDEILDQIAVLWGDAASKSQEQKGAEAKASINTAEGAQEVLNKLYEAQTEWKKLSANKKSK